MKKSILFLINGYGVEQTDSIDVYSKEVMPNLDEIINNNFLIKMPNKFLDYKSGYRNFSMGIDRDLSHSLIERNISMVEYNKNELLKYIINETIKNDSNLHIFGYIDSYNAFQELAIYVKNLKIKVKKSIIIHFVLSQKSLKDYEEIRRGLTYFTYEIGSNVKIGLVTGENNMNSDNTIREIVKCLMTNTGEKWKDFSKRIDVFIQNKEFPNTARTFAINYSFKIEEGDQILFFNYSNIDLTKFKKEIESQKYVKFDFNKIAYYSLFPVKCNVQIPFMYNYALASNCFLNSLSSINANCLVLDKKENCSFINYYMTGLRNNVDDRLKYLATDDNFIYDENKLLDVLNKYDKDLIIINYNIDNPKSVEDLKEKLTKIDALIKCVYDFSINNNRALYISSFYGMDVDLYNKKAELCKVNLFSKVPLIIVNTDFSLKDYNVVEGNLFDLSNALLYTINNKYPNSGFYKKKKGLFSIFKK